MRRGWNSRVVVICSTIALLLLIAVASSCHFLSLPPSIEENTNTTGVEETNNGVMNDTTGPTATRFGGVYCQGEWDMETAQDDSMLVLSKVFLSFALVLGCISAALSWIVLCGPNSTKSSPMTWLCVSVSAALCAICCVPIFLVFSTEPCTNSNQSDDEGSCELAAGAYILISSLALWIAVTITTQCVDPPNTTSLDDRRGLLSTTSKPTIPQQRNADRALWRRWWDGLVGGGRTTGMVQLPPSTDLKVDRTMMEDDDEEAPVGTGGYSPHGSSDEPMGGEDGIEVTAEYAAALMLDTPTIMEYDGEDQEDDDDNDEEAKEEEGSEILDPSERTLVMRNDNRKSTAGIGGTAASSAVSSSVPYSDENSTDSMYYDDSGESQSLETSLYSSSVLESTGMILYPRNLVNRDLATQTSMAMPPPLLMTSTDHIYQELDASLEAESSALAIVGIEDRPEVGKTLYYGKAALADSIEDEEDDDDDEEEGLGGATRRLADEEKEDRLEGDKVEESDITRRYYMADVEEDLGSLEPTVIEVTGEESILDQESSNLAGHVRGRSKERNNNASARAMVQKVMQSPMDLGLAVISRAKSGGRRRIVKGYKLMDDSDMTTSYPWSPPLEILTLNIARDTSNKLDDLDPTLSSNKKEQDLLDEWNSIHKSSPSFAQTFSDEPEQQYYDSSDDENEDDVQRSGIVQENAPDDEQGQGTMDDTSPSKTTEGTTRRRRRGRRTHRSYGGRSVASSTSLLSATIAEETAEDLEASDDAEVIAHEPNDAQNVLPYTRSRSAPALARFGRLRADSGNVLEDIRMTGIHSYHNVQVFRAGGSARSSRGSAKSSRDKDSVDSSTEQSSDATGPRRRNRFIPSSSFSVPEQRTQPRLTAKKVPMFRQERAIRSGIHSQSYVSDPSSSEDKSAVTSPSLRSRQARQARLRRLQCQVYTSPPRRGTSEEPTRTNRATPQSESLSNYSGIHGSEYSSDGKENTSYDSGNYMIDLLDVQLAELNRPDGANIGPDEASL